jgi:hypothetical protein
VRLFLDAQISGPRIAAPLREAGHDVRAADEERTLDGWSDRVLLSLAAREARIMVTFNVRDFPLIVREWATADAHHAGCAILVGIDHGEFGVIIRALESTLAARPDQADWKDYTCFVGRHG